ncbi:Cytochrome c551 peroxidase [Paramagnetospirillum magnetotacticum MS-1]|uniref:Methylamine utilization protein MauG n=1 Tax=Paramagnetospirillum magnetotacticum MS-1 TaxID=272627 RepID=A0A0C2YB46_PARME|nr:cytochrome c peroxidase [Paramagnetospirillum magnetotacticum]KIL96974.1 Cytochrome c551 peroxidase [Paramagnetospirillum magnetotacticum MS-1]
MNADLSQILTTGAMVVLFAISALVLLVRMDLAPAGDRPSPLDGGGRWFLGAALGIGVIAFSIKLAIILTLSSFPDQTIAPLLADPALAQRDDSLAEMPLQSGPSGPGHYPWRSLPAVAPSPPDNPTNPAKIALGERLFHDTALSRDHTVSCATCHDLLEGAGTDRRPTSKGINGTIGGRNAPTVWNAAFQSRLFWDGRAGSLEEQAMGPPLNPDEMGMPSATAIEARIGADSSYRQAFAQAFGDGASVTMRRITQAIAAFERTLVTNDSPYDRFVAGDDHALDPAQKRGMWLFQSVGCVMCHSGPNFSGAALVGPQNPYAPLMASRSAFAQRHGLSSDKGKAHAKAVDGIWRIPSLRNVALTAPYFHNGSVTELEEAIRVMATSQLNATISEDRRQSRTPAWSAENSRFDVIDRLVLSEDDIRDLAAFLRSLSSDRLARRLTRAP